MGAPPTLAEMLGSFGPVEVTPLSRIQALTAKAMTRNWTTIPHVTHNDLIDVTALEAARKQHNAAREGAERLTPTPFLLKALAAVLQRLPRFNTALDETGANLIQRRYTNLGLAIDTPNGLLVGVIRDCDKKSVQQIAIDAKALSDKARAKGLTLSDMSGGGFTLSALGNLGGTSFTPIINGPEVAILGVSRLTQQPTRGANDEIVWRQCLPVALSYDHRVVNGADAGRFMQALQEEIDALARA
jgi:pyruvate dehydrogenase E2 component (dihydrolipoamide acetyltransferase)